MAMRVQIDQTGHDQLAGDIDNVGPGACQVAAQSGDLAVGEGDVGDLVASARRIDDPPAGEDQLRHCRSRNNRVSLHGVASRKKPDRLARREVVGLPPKAAPEMTASPKAVIEPSPRCRVDGEAMMPVGNATRLNLLLLENP